MVRVASLYFRDNWTQQEIADRLGVSRFVVGRWLKRARDIGLVRIEIVPIDVSMLAIAAELEGVLDIQRCVVVPTAPGADMGEVRRQIGEAGARYLESLVRPADTIAVPWGRTLAELAARLRPIAKPSVTICELVGGVGQVTERFAAHEVAARIAERLGGRCVYLHAPVLVNSMQTRDVLLHEGSIRRAIELAERADIVLLGAGAPTADHVLVLAGFISPPEIESIARAGAVAHIGGWFVDAAGRELPNAFSERTVALPLSQIRRIPTKIFATGGPDTIAGIIAAVRGGLLDVLITDSASAEAVLRHVKETPVSAASSGR